MEILEKKASTTVHVISLMSSSSHTGLCYFYLYYFFVGKGDCHHHVSVKTRRFWLSIGNETRINLF